MEFLHDYFVSLLDFNNNFILTSNFQIVIGEETELGYTKMFSEETIRVDKYVNLKVECKLHKTTLEDMVRKISIRLFKAMRKVQKTPDYANIMHKAFMNIFANVSV